jgi:ammonium transporter, Amt family
MTSAIMLFIKFVLRVPLRMSEDKLIIGDEAIHGEDAYAFGDAYTIGQVSHATPDAELDVTQAQSGANGDENKWQQV